MDINVLKTRVIDITWLVHRWLSNNNPLHLWKKNPDFMATMKEIRWRTLVDTPRCYTLYQYARQVMTLPGDVAEVGVYRGGTARLLAKTAAASGKTVHLFDTFSGLPESDPARDVMRAGELDTTSLKDVTDFLSDCPNIQIHPGFFPDTARPVLDKQFCFVNIDVDLYRSVLDCLEVFYPRMVAGGVLLFDDYGFKSCRGVKTAVDEFFAKKPERPLYLTTGQCVVVKL